MSRDRKLLDLCQNAPCQLRLASPCGQDPSVPAHSDMLRHGRGVGHKSSAVFAIPACPNCHAAFTRGYLGKTQYEEVWRQAHERWLQYIWDNKLIDVR